MMCVHQIKLGKRKISWSKKQIVVPEAAISALELEEGDFVQFILVDSKVFLEKEKL
jgi:bifunctional DNA-binding transcriptional regulator/antitoxin component of YhaV-PrlF toxin-antitoxin module